MKNLTKKIIITALIVSPLLLSVAAAQVAPNPTVPSVNVRSMSDINRIITTVINWLTGIFFAVAILFIFYSAFLFLRAAGDEERLKKAKEYLMYSLVAIAVALLAGTARYLIESTLNA